MKKFEYIVPVKDHNWGHDDLEKECWQTWGPKWGKCDDAPLCEYDFDRWYYTQPYQDILDKKLDSCRKDDTADIEKIIKDHFNWVFELPDCPRDHSHPYGIWSTKWVKKTGYDYGIQNYLFENQEDAVYFTLTFMKEYHHV